VLAGTIISGAVGCAPKGNLPYISEFKANSPLKEGDAANYVIKVNYATKILFYEAGVLIGEFNGPPTGTHKFTFKGMPANSIPTENGKFEALLVISNDKGKLEKKLLLSIATPAPPQAALTGSSDNETGQRSYWGNQSFLQVSSTEPTPEPTTSNISPPTDYPPKFVTCPQGCCNCLEPGDAAAQGFTQRCSDELCYYSPGQVEKYYCYKDPEGWCCANGTVNQATKTECKGLGGYWSLNQNDAMQACQPKGYCCYNGQVYYPVSQSECAQRGGSYWSTNQAEVMQVCQPPCWCCIPGSQVCPRRGECYYTSGSVTQTTQDQCRLMGGNCYPDPNSANAACQPRLPR